MNIRKWLGVSLFAMMIASLMMSAGVSAQDATPAAQQSFPVKIRFLNAMTAQNEIDVFINGSDKDQRVVEGLPYGTFSDYFEGTAPASEIIVKNNVEFGVDQWLFDVVIATEPGKSYIVVISDLLAIPTVVDTTVNTEAGGRGKLIHASSQAPALDVYINDDLVLRDLKFGRAGYGGALAAGTYDLKLTQSGTENVALEQPGIVVEAGKVYTYVVIGEPGSTEEPLTVVVAEDTLEAS